MAKRRQREDKSADECHDACFELEARGDDASDAPDAEHGELGTGTYLVRHPDYLVIVRRPEYVTFKRFIDSGKFSLEARDKFGRPCVVYPSKDEYAKLAGARPGVIVAVADAAALL